MNNLSVNQLDPVVRMEELSVLIEENKDLLDAIQKELAKVIIGQSHMNTRLLIALISSGHILLEGVPGLAKTLAIKTLSEIIHSKFNRIQFTPDLLPADITGTVIYSPKTESFTVKKGPIFSNLILADEINRAPAKVQSALLEAMQEEQVTIGDETYPLPQPFMVLATQNPIDQEGTYGLPEAQVDRFMLKINLTYPSPQEEKMILHQELNRDKSSVVKSVCTTEQLLKLRGICKEIYVDPKIESYIVDIVYATREPNLYGLGYLTSMIESGASPRATVNIAKAARALAMLRGRAFVIPEDVKAVAADVLNHRIKVSYEGEAEQMTALDIIHSILFKIEVP